MEAQLCHLYFYPPSLQHAPSIAPSLSVPPAAISLTAHSSLCLSCGSPSLPSSPLCPFRLLLLPGAKSGQEEPCVSKVDWIGNRSRVSVFIKPQLRHLAPTPVWRSRQIGDSSNSPAAHMLLFLRARVHTHKHTQTAQHLGLFSFITGVSWGGGGRSAVECSPLIHTHTHSHFHPCRHLG